MEQDYSNLSGKTVFDFIDEKTAEEYALCTKEQHEKSLEDNKWDIVYTLIDFATDTNNVELLHNIEEQYADIFKKVFNE